MQLKKLDHYEPQLTSTTSTPHKNNDLLSATVASIILFCWFFSLIELLRLDISNLSWVVIFSFVCIRAFFHTGIFIILHEAIHGVVVSSRQINDYIGRVACLLYAFLPYKAMAENHHLHHRYPATEEDPDFFCTNPRAYLSWYCSFMRKYQHGKQFWILFWGMTVIFWILIFLQVSVANIFLFWVIPIVISSLQLFTFGIFLPHRESSRGYSDRHRANSINYPVFLSFLACYHFGYHWEHHEHPYLPWYRLPLVRQKS